MPKRLSILLVATLLIGSLLSITLNLDSTAIAAAYVGASTTGKFHYDSCRWANKILTITKYISIAGKKL